MELDRRLESYREDMIRSLQELIRIRSVEGEPKENMPFGEGPYQALNYMLNLAESMGFQTLNVDNYAGHIDLGSGEETVGILVHLDVVPEGEGWTYPPYGGEIHDGKIYGRGALDDKGPAIAVLYAMKAIQESGLSISKKVRMILGTNEETNWNDIPYYLERVKKPDLAFVPDADFPVIHGEKGILIFDLKKKLNQPSKGNLVLEKIQGGNAPNMVPDGCTAILRVDSDVRKDVEDRLRTFVQETGWDLSMKETEPGRITISCKGKSAHGSTPEKGINAISRLMKFLGELPFEDCDAKEIIRLYNRHIGMEYYGESIGCGLEDEVSGKLIFNVGMIDVDEKEVTITVNIRYPVTISSEKVYSGMRQSLKDTGIEIIEQEDMKPIYIPEDHELIQKLMQVYREKTGDLESKPIVIGGGTYARAIENAVAFGPLFPGQPGVEHQKDEHISVDALLQCAKIYAEAIYQLAK